MSWEGVRPLRSEVPRLGRTDCLEASGNGTLLRTKTHSSGMAAEAPSAHSCKLEAPSGSSDCHLRGRVVFLRRVAILVDFQFESTNPLALLHSGISRRLHLSRSTQTHTAGLFSGDFGTKAFKRPA